MQRASRIRRKVIPIELGIKLGIDVYNFAKLFVNMDNRDKWGYLSTGVGITFEGNKALWNKGKTPLSDELSTYPQA